MIGQQFEYDLSIPNTLKVADRGIENELLILSMHAIIEFEFAGGIIDTPSGKTLGGLVDILVDI